MLALDAPVKLDLGCGENKLDGFVGVDIAPCEGVDYIADLSVQAHRWRLQKVTNGQVQQTGHFLPDDSVDEVYCSHFFEHLDGLERIAFMNELGRIMKVGALARIIVPYGISHRALQDPTHKWPPVVETSFLYFWEKYRRDNKLLHYPITCNFYYTFEPVVFDEWTLRSQEARNFAMKHYGNVVSDLHVFLTKLAEGEDEPAKTDKGGDS